MRQDDYPGGPRVLKGALKVQDGGRREGRDGCGRGNVTTEKSQRQATLLAMRWRKEVTGQGMQSSL